MGEDEDDDLRTNFVIHSPNLRDIDDVEDAGDISPDASSSPLCSRVKTCLSVSSVDSNFTVNLGSKLRVISSTVAAVLDRTTSKHTEQKQLTPDSRVQ